MPHVAVLSLQLVPGLTFTDVKCKFHVVEVGSPRFLHHTA